MTKREVVTGGTVLASPSARTVPPVCFIHPIMKRHRMVVVDNPYGKASSDHVLNPVFFMVEQLFNGARRSLFFAIIKTNESLNMEVSQWRSTTN